MVQDISVERRQASEQRDRSLQGWKIVVTRSEEQSDSLTERLRLLGAEPIAYPTIMVVPPEDIRPLDEALQGLIKNKFHWLVLTSVNAVNAVKNRFDALGYSFPLSEQDPLPSWNLAAVGPTTTKACRELLGVSPSVVPKKFVAEALAEALGEMQGQRVLLANADISRPILQQRLQEAGAVVERVVAYHTVLATGGVDVPRLLSEGSIDAITFTSGSTARYFVQRIGPESLKYAQQKVIACIGPIAADGAKEVGLPPSVVAQTYTEEGLIEALLEYASTRKE
jgi:uroporphyrinogen-III synthase